MPRPKTPVTLQTIAKFAKVSPSVVSTVLTGYRGSIRFSEETADRVRAAARQLHYRPNRMAQSMRGKRHQAIGLLSSSIFALPPAFLHWLSLALGERDQLLVIQGLPPVDPVAHCQLLQQGFVDAFICAETPHPTVLKRIVETALPALFVNADPGIPAARILYDEAGGMRLVVEHLKERGFRRIVLYDVEDAGGYWTDERRKGCVAATQALGLPPPRIVSVQPSMGISDAQDADQLVAACEPGTGVIAQNGQVAPFLLPRLEARGLRVPTDVGVVTLGHAPPMDMTWTRAEVNTKDLAAMATSLVLAPGALGSGICRRAPYAIHQAASTGRG